jgi:hypothetical protein
MARSHMNSTLKSLLENKMIEREDAEIFNVLQTTNAKAEHASNEHTTKIVITVLVIYVKIKSE